jgi:tetratricopeptide (TPR) repeat protein
MMLLAFFNPHSRAATEAPSAGRIVNFKGNVRVVLADRAVEIEPKIGHELGIGDMVQTGTDGWSAILMADETLIQLNRNTRFVLKEVETSAGWHGLRGVIPASGTTPGRSVYKVDSGEMWLRNKNKNARISVETPTISAGIRGTELNTVVAENKAVTMTILEGLVECRNEYGDVTAGPGEEITANPGMPPQKRMLISPTDAVQWTLTVPPMDDRYAFPIVSSDPVILKAEQNRLQAILSKNRNDIHSLLALAEVTRGLNQLNESEALFNEILRKEPLNAAALTGIGWVALEQQKTADAISAFEKVAKPTPMTLLGKSVLLTRLGRYREAESVLSEGASRHPDFPAFYLQEASLKVERRDLLGAKDLLEKLIEKKPDYGPALSLLALVSLTRGENAAAVKWARQGVRIAPGSPAAQVVLSQAYQAVFDLDQAMSTAETAVRIDPTYVPALVIKARLLFGANRTDEAMETIDSAFRLAPKDADVLNLKGFLLLARRDIEAAATSFKSALKTDPGMGEPHLGLSLIRMRQGNVADAMEEITTAVLLEPRRSVFVSYWAKMLYQVKRFDRAMEALDYAAKLDPLDPTPFLYQAIILRDLNRPTEAVEALNRAIELNDNRAVYRSRFLLDRDLAVKNVDQTIIFQELGLSDWSRSKALASVKTDYQNSAGHTFLAGSLLSMGNRLRSGSSENLLGMMLQQANLNSLNTFQDYTSFFETPSISGILSGTAGNHDTYSGEAIVFGAIPAANLAFNSIADYTETDGWRDTNGSRTKGAGINLKWDPTPKDGFVLISSHLNSRAKDSPDDPYEYDAPSQPDDWRTSRTNHVTLGYHRALSPKADLLLMGKHYEGDFESLGNSASWFDKNEGLAFFSKATNDVNIPTDQLQAHLLYRLGDHQLILGSLQHWRKRHVDNTTLDELWQLYEGWWYYIDALSYETNNTVRDWYQSYYVQDIWHLTPWLTAEAALYYDVLKNHNLYTAVQQNHEKVNPRIGLIFTPTHRDTIRIAGFRYLVPYTIDRLDPTDIGGVPLFRNAYDNSVSEEYDLVWEHDWKTGYVSMSLFYIESEVEERWTDMTTTTWRARAKGIEPVWNQLLWKGFGLSVRYRFLDITDEYSSQKDREDHLAAATLNYLHPSGLFAGISQAYRREFFTESSRNDENIWLTDLSLGYKFPNKRGVFRVDVQNLFDHHFNWVVDDMVFDGRIPVRGILGTLSLYF